MNYYRGSGMGQIPKIVKNLLILNIVVFILTMIGKSSQRYDLNNILALYFPLSENFQPFQLITYMFMHGSIGHIFFNMFALWMFGRVLEGVWGEKRFFIYFMVTGIGAALFQITVNYIRFLILKNQISPELFAEVMEKGADILQSNKNYSNEVLGKLNLLINIPTVGASGAIFGILMAFGMMFPDARLMLLFPPIPIRGKYIAIFALVAGMLFDFRGNVAHFAHLGGMVFGYILIKYWKRKTPMY